MRRSLRCIKCKAVGLRIKLGPIEGGRVFRTFIAEQGMSWWSGKCSECPVQDEEPEPTSYAAACTSQPPAVPGEAMAIEYESWLVDGTFTLTRSRPKECNVVKP